MAFRSGKKLAKTARALGVLLFFAGSATLATLSFSSGKTMIGGPRLGLDRFNIVRPSNVIIPRSPLRNTVAPAVLRADAPTFGHPVISGIGGTGFEESIRIDPSNPNRIYTSAPGTASADTSWIWRSLDGGKTFKWVPGSAPLTGKVTTCHGGGDTEIAVDSAGHLFFNDLTLANFSTARSDDLGATFTCSNTGVPDSVVDRQWYALDGVPTNGGTLYLANDEVGPGGVSCPGTSLPGNNVLVMYRSPVTGALASTAGVAFGPPNHVTPVLGCDEAIMGNNEVSPVATKTGQPNGAGGYTQLASAVKHIYVVHDTANLQQIRVGRCFPVDFGLPVANSSDPSGLNCTDLLVADLGPNQKTGGDFPTMAIDASGNLYAVWEQAPANGAVLTGDVQLKFSYSTDEGNTWSAPITIDTSGSPVGTLHQNVFAWINAGDTGRVNIVWYGTPDLPNGGNNGPDDCNTCTWSVWMTQSLNANSANPVFTPPILATEHPVHRGAVQSLIGGQNQLSSRSLGDYLQARMGPQGEAHIAYADSNNIIGSAAGHAMYVHQNGGTGLLNAIPQVNVPGIKAFNTVTDISGDGKYEALGASTANMAHLDLLKSQVSLVATAPCSPSAPCYRIDMQVNNLSLSPATAPDTDTDLVWSTQWFVPSKTDPAGGKNFHAYAESNGGAALQCFVGENAVALVGGGAVLSYPGGTTPLPAPNCQSTLGPNGTISIYVPLSQVSEADPIDNKLHEVTAATMTLPAPANSNPSVGGIGGVEFNLIDVAQGYVFDPALVTITSITRSGTGPAVITGKTAPNLTISLEVSPDLITPFAFLASVNADSSGTWQYSDAGAVGLSKRFYRAVYP